tara:strand:- start:1963 stop:2211 length:249 start_codon:yes stop_codon:yes gene_type:complete
MAIPYWTRIMQEINNGTLKNKEEILGSLAIEEKRVRGERYSTIHRTNLTEREKRLAEDKALEHDTLREILIEGAKQIDKRHQ